MAHNLSPLQQALAAWTEQWKEQPQMRLYRLQESWSEVVGKILAKKSFIGQYEGATVTVLADNSVWLNELFIQREKIVKKLAARFPEYIITDLKLRTGRRAQQAPKKAAEKQKQEHIPALTAAQKEEVTAFFAAVSDPTLQQSLIHLRERQLALELARREAGFVPCTICHQLTDAVDGICEMCKLRAQAQERHAVTRYLKKHPAASYRDVIAAVGTSESMYAQARQYLIYRTLDHIYHRVETAAEQVMLASLLTGIKPRELTEDHVHNLLAKFARKAEDK